MEDVVVINYSDGYHWVIVSNQKEYNNEKDNNNNLVTNTYNHTTSYVLKDNIKNHYIVVTVDESRACITQCVDKNNNKPHEKYHTYIVDLMLNKDFKADHFDLEYDNEKNFTIDDLDDILYVKLLSHNTRWLHENNDLKRFYNLFKNNIEFLKKIDDVPLLKLLYENKNDNDIAALIEALDGKKMIFPGGTVTFHLNNVFIDSKLNVNLLSKIKYELTFTKQEHYNFDNMRYYMYILKNIFNNKESICNLATNYIVISLHTISKIKHIEHWQEKLKKLLNYYIQNIFYKKIVKERILILQEIENETKIKFIKKEDVGGDDSDNNDEYIIKMYISQFLNNLFTPDKTSTCKLYNILPNLYENLKLKFNNITHKPTYNFINDINEYILNNISNNHLLNDILLKEKYGVPSDIEEWYDLIYYIITVQLNGFIKAVKKEPQKFKEILEIDGDEVEVYTAEISTQKEINKLITKYISKNNKLKLKNLTLKLSVTILPEEYFENYLFPTDAYYNDNESYFDGTYLNDCEIYIEIYLPDVVISEDDEEAKYLFKIMNDYEINLKIRQTLSHELHHAYEFFQHIKSESNILLDRNLNKIRAALKEHPLTYISNDLSHFLDLVYLSLSYEVSARVTEIYYKLKEYKIDNLTYFWSVVKESVAWREMELLRNFDSEDFYNNIEFEMSDEEIKKALLESGMCTEDDFEKYDIKTLVIRQWLKKLDSLIDRLNKKYNINLKRVSREMFDHPKIFFKYYEKKFKDAWKYFYDRVSKISVIFVKNNSN